MPETVHPASWKSIQFPKRTVGVHREEDILWFRRRPLDVPLGVLDREAVAVPRAGQGGGDGGRRALPEPLAQGEHRRDAVAVRHRGRDPGEGAGGQGRGGRPPARHGGVGPPAPRGRHEYTEAEIAGAKFDFSLRTVSEG